MVVLMIEELRTIHPELCVDVEIEVTQEDIDRATRGDNRRCPIAWAVKRANEARGGSPYALLVGSMPESARAFVRDFEAGHPVRPFTFKAVGWRGEVIDFDRGSL